MKKMTCKLLAALLCLALLAGCATVPGTGEVPPAPTAVNTPDPTAANTPAPTGAPTPGPTGEPAGAIPNEDGEIGGKNSREEFDVAATGGLAGGIVAADGFYGMAGGAAESAAAAMAPSLAEAPSAGGWDMEDEGVWIPPGDYQGPTPAAGLLTAGSWDDNRDWSSFLDNAGQTWDRLMSAWSLDPTHRVEVRLTGNGAPVQGAGVCLLAGQELLWQAVTDYEGRAFLFWSLAGADSAPDHVTVQLGDRDPEDFPLAPGQTLLELEPNGAARAVSKVDVMFMVDTTGSMSDELEYLKAELEDVLLRAGEALPNAALRLSVNFYRDEGDEYVVRYFRFHEDISQAVESLRAQFASGGGDRPEAVDQALDNAVNGHAWEPDAVKLLFLVLDAPPHVDREGTPESIRASLTQAAAMGIRIIPVASSGVDEETEFVTRTAAVLTGGTYTFLTDHSGIGGSHKDPTNIDYEVEPLNELLLRLIVQYAGGEMPAAAKETPGAEETPDPAVTPVSQPEEPVLPEHEHDYQERTFGTPFDACVGNTTIFVCECGDCYVRTLPPHSFAYEEGDCTVCGLSEEEYYTSETGEHLHRYTTCARAGDAPGEVFVTYICKCGYGYEETVEDHQCVVDFIWDRCSVCGRTMEEVVAQGRYFPLGDKMVSVDVEEFYATPLMLYKDLSPLKQCKNLKTVHLNCCDVDDLSTLAGIDSLETLCVVGCNFTVPVTLDFLTELPGLRTLRLWGSNFEKTCGIAPLAALTDLQVLTLASWEVTDVTPLAALTDLRELDLRHNPIEDATPLTALKNLEKLVLPDTVSPEQEAVLRAALPDCDIEFVEYYVISSPADE